MGKIVIEFDDAVLAKAIAAVLADEKPAKSSGSMFDKADTKASKTRKNAKSKSTVTVQDIMDLVKEIGIKECRPVLKEAGYASPKALKEADLDEEEIEEILASLKELQSEEDEDESDEDDDEESDDDDEDESDDEIDVELVKKAVQAFAKENGKEAADEILEEFEIKSVRSLNKLDQEQLEELYEAVTE